MNENSARNVIRSSIRVMALLDSLADDLQKTLPDHEFDEQRRIIGKIMGMVSLELLNPTVALYPSSELVSRDGWQRAGELTAPYWLDKLHKP